MRRLLHPGFFFTNLANLENQDLTVSALKKTLSNFFLKI